MLTINDIKTGYSFDYQSKQWRAVEKYFYKWNKDETISTEFKIQSGTETKYLEIDQNANIVSISKKINYDDLSGEAGSDIVSFNDIDYTIEKGHSGIYWEENNEMEKEAFDVWDYFDNTKENWISVEEWDHHEFEAYAGKIIDPSEISNIQEGISLKKSSGNETQVAFIFAVIIFIIASLIGGRRQEVDRRSRTSRSTGRYSRSRSRRSFRGGK